jgi:hypothetical protein
VVAAAAAAVDPPKKTSSSSSPKQNATDDRHTMLPRATAALARSAALAAASAPGAARRALSSSTIRSKSNNSSIAAASATAARPLSTTTTPTTPTTIIINKTGNGGALPLLASSSSSSTRALASGSGVATKSGLAGEPLTTVTPEKRLSAIARMWARTRDMPELGVMYLGVATGLSLLVYTVSELVFNTKRGEHVGILLNPDVRGDFERQVSSADSSAHEAARHRGGAPAGSSGPAGGRASLWYVLGHLMIDEKGANVSIPPFDNRKLRGPFPYNKPGGEAGLGAGGDAYGSPPADVAAAGAASAR